MLKIQKEAYHSRNAWSGGAATPPPPGPRRILRLLRPALLSRWWDGYFAGLRWLPTCLAGCAAGSPAHPLQNVNNHEIIGTLNIAWEEMEEKEKKRRREIMKEKGREGGEG